MFTYNINKVASNEEFKKACRKIEDSKLNIKKNTVLIDVDGSLIQIYNVNKDTITVYNDYEVDAVYIDSDVNLDSLFI